MTLFRNKKFLPNHQISQFMEWVILMNVVTALDIVPNFLVKKRRARIQVHTNVDKYNHSLIRVVLIQSCSAGAENLTNYVFCHVQFNGVIQNIENRCAILTPVCLIIVLITNSFHRNHKNSIHT